MSPSADVTVSRRHHAAGRKVQVSIFVAGQRVRPAGKVDECLSAVNGPGGVGYDPPQTAKPRCALRFLQLAPPLLQFLYTKREVLVLLLESFGVPLPVADL